MILKYQEKEKEYEYKHMDVMVSLLETILTSSMCFYIFSYLTYTRRDLVIYTFEIFYITYNLSSKVEKVVPTVFQLMFE